MGLWSISCWRLCIGQPWLWRITGNWGSVPERTHEKRRSQLRLAAGAKTFRISNAWKGDYQYQQLLFVVDWNGRLLDLVSSSKFRASLVPAAAVIPAELEMGNIVAVKTYVVIFVFVLHFLNVSRRALHLNSFKMISANKLERSTWMLYMTAWETWRYLMVMRLS